MRISDWSSDVCSSDLLLDRRTVHEDDLRLEVGIARYCTGELRGIVPIDKDQVLLDRNEVERVHPVPGRGDEVTLLIANIPFEGDARVIIQATGSPCRRDALDRLWPENTLLNALRKNLIHTCQLTD